MAILTRHEIYLSRFSPWLLEEGGERRTSKLAIKSRGQMTFRSRDFAEEPKRKSACVCVQINGEIPARTDQITLELSAKGYPNNRILT